MATEQTAQLHRRYFTELHGLLTLILFIVLSSLAAVTANVPGADGVIIGIPLVMIIVGTYLCRRDPVQKNGMTVLGKWGFRLLPIIAYVHLAAWYGYLPNNYTTLITIFWTIVLSAVLTVLEYNDHLANRMTETASFYAVFVILFVAIYSLAILFLGFAEESMLTILVISLITINITAVTSQNDKPNWFSNIGRGIVIVLILMTALHFFGMVTGISIIAMSTSVICVTEIILLVVTLGKFCIETSTVE